MSTLHQKTAPKGESRDDWETPDDLWRLLNLEFQFRLDVAAEKANARCRRWYGPDNEAPALADGLAAAWNETWWCNPPFTDLAAWAAKARGETLRQRQRGVMLIPANRTDQSWWHEIVVPSIADGLCRIRYLRGRLRFKGAPSTAGFACLLLVWGPK